MNQHQSLDQIAADLNIDVHTLTDAVEAVNVYYEELAIFDHIEDLARLRHLEELALLDHDSPEHWQHIGDDDEGRALDRE